jgi:hypothetical protein
MSKSIVVAAVLSAAFPAWSQDEAVTGQQIQDAWADKHLVGNTANGRRFFMRFEKDGKASISVGDFSDSGSWRPDDKGYCAKWTKIRNGDEACFSVVKNGSSYRVLNPDGTLSGTVSSIR